MLTFRVPGAIAVYTCWLALLAASADAEVVRATIHWDGVPLGDAVTRLSNTLGVDVMIDRRVDPSRRVSLVVRDASAAEILSQLAEAQSLGVSQLGGLLYLGPRDAATELRTLAALRRDEVAQLPEDERAALMRARTIEWPRLTEPRALITNLLSQRNWEVRQSELIAHDLWPAGRLPKLTIADQLTVLLAGLNLTYHIIPRERALEIVRIESPVRLSRDYPWPGRSAQDVVLLQQQLPESQVRVDGRTLRVSGRLEDHERLTGILEGSSIERQRAPHPRETKRVFTLHVEQQPAGVILRQLGKQLELTIEVDDAAIRATGLALERRVSLSVENVDVDQLLDALLKPIGLDYERGEQQLKIFPRNAGD